MSILETVFFIFHLVFAITCSYHDFRRGIIPNRTILVGFLCGILLHILFLCLETTESTFIWLMDMLIADAFSFLLFYSKLWAAGDAKLFMLLFFLTPSSLFDEGGITNSITPYIFIFVPALAWVFAETVIRLIRKEPGKKRPVQIRKRIISCIVVMTEVTAIYCIASVLFKDFLSRNGMFFSALILIYAYFCGSNIYMGKWPVILVHAVIILTAWIMGKWTFTIPRWQDYVLIAVLLAVQSFTSLYNYQLIETEKVKAGMIPAAETIILFRNSRIQSLPKDFSEELTAKITPEEAEAICRWGKSKNGKSHIWIVRKVPFAFMIALGFAGWIIFQFVR